MLWYPKDADGLPKPPPPTTDPNSVIMLPVKLNVGGTIYQTTERTLRAEPQSWFVEQLEKEWKRYLNGEIFIDRNGTLFELVLDYLRHGDQTALPDDDFMLRRLRLEAHFYKLPGLRALIDGPFEFDETNSERVVWFRMRDTTQHGCIRYGGLARMVERKSYFMQTVNSHLENRIGMRKETPIIIPERKADVSGLQPEQYTAAFKLFMNIVKRGVAGSAAATDAGELCAPDLQVLCYLCRLAEYYQLHRMLQYLDSLRPKCTHQPQHTNGLDAMSNKLW